MSRDWLFPHLLFIIADRLHESFFFPDKISLELFKATAFSFGKDVELYF